ncbi:hypothetical protein AMJ39_09825 [candidate division TA06 bacterium DG_24]|uniref:Uncharacterized protein n=1 Tax=candidate division TA06 bacterium DG_24 TaxID=1703770 RepID=A0A0S7WN29_UNCT6|nr:MAG: hypothetical protein AMJ39_09825 [candidate division TA06 bacterium DG_24]
MEHPRSRSAAEFLHCRHETQIEAEGPRWPPLLLYAQDDLLAVFLNHRSHEDVTRYKNNAEVTRSGHDYLLLSRSIEQGAGLRAGSLENSR